MELKYIIVKLNENDQDEAAIIFSKKLMHKAVARIHRIPEYIVVSAGFCSIDGDKVAAWGHSETLNKSSRPQDKDIIERDFKGK